MEEDRLDQRDHVSAGVVTGTHTRHVDELWEGTGSEGTSAKLVREHANATDLTLLDGGGAGTVGAVALVLRRVVTVLGARVRRGDPLLVAVVTLLRLGDGVLRLAELQTDLPVLLLHLAHPRLQDGPLQDLGRGRVGQTGRQEEGAAICGGVAKPLLRSCPSECLLPRQLALGLTLQVSGQQVEPGEKHHGHQGRRQQLQASTEQQVHDGRARVGGLRWASVPQRTPAASLHLHTH